MIKRPKYNFRPLIEPVLLTEQTWPEDTCPLVCSGTLTFNHAKFIRQCLNGLIMQKTTFPVKITIHDDASTDGTRQILQEYENKYPNLIWVYYQKENIYNKPNKYELRQPYYKERNKGKYIALCEGDDYWTDPYKLQKQVDFLEANPEYAICFHPVKIFKQDEQQLVDDYITREVPETTDVFELAKGNYIHTCSVVFRNSIKEFPKEIYKSPVGDYFLHMLNAQNGSIKKLNDCMAVYRVHVGGVWSNNDKQQVKIIQYLNLMIDYFSECDFVDILIERRKKIIKSRTLLSRLKRKLKKWFIQS